MFVILFTAAAAGVSLASIAWAAWEILTCLGVQAEEKGE